MVRWSTSWGWSFICRNTHVERINKGTKKQVVSTTIQSDDNDGPDDGGDNGSGDGNAPN